MTLANEMSRDGNTGIPGAAANAGKIEDEGVPDATAERLEDAVRRSMLDLESELTVLPIPPKGASGERPPGEQQELR